MSFLDELRDFLRHPVPARTRNLPAYRRHFVATLERKEREGATEQWLREQHVLLGTNLRALVERIEQQLLAEGLPPEELSALVKYAVSFLLGIDESEVSTTRKLIVQHIAQSVYDSVAFRDISQSPLPWQSIGLYAEEIRAVQSNGGEALVTPIGRVFLDLSGMNAVAWLLHVEVALSTGQSDEWRLDRETLRYLVGNPRLSFPWDVWPHEGPELNWSALQRLEALGLVEFPEEGNITGYAVQEHALPVLSELANNPDSPMAVLAHALLQDDVHSRLPNISAPSSAAVMAQQARLVVHEVRNALIPVQVALGNIYRAAQDAGLEQAITTHRQRVDAGLERVLAFATEQQRMASLADRAQDVFELEAALREAVAVVRGEEGRTPELSVAENLPPLLGVRARFVLALVNLLRNAYQASAEEVAVRVAVTGDEQIRLVIDDDGPGVASELRESIFMQGYSTRAGGSGQGLALAKDTIENEMGGTLACEDGSSLGGARFVMILEPHDRSTT